MSSIFRKLPFNFGKIFYGFIAFAIACNMLGYALGDAFSPKYDNEIDAYKFIISEIKYIQDGDRIVSLKLDAGPTTFEYLFEEEVFKKSLRPTSELLSLKSPKRNKYAEFKRAYDWIGISASVPAGAAGAAVAVKAAADELPILRQARSGSRYFMARIVLGLAVVGGASGYLGYKLSYDDTNDYSNAKFQKALNNIKIYRRIAYEVNVCQALSRYRDDFFLDLLNERVNTVLSISNRSGPLAFPFWRQNKHRLNSDTVQKILFRIALPTLGIRRLKTTKSYWIRLNPRSI